MFETIQIIEAVEGKEGREWDVVLIAPGLSKNGNFYPPDVLKSATPLFEGAYAYADHASDKDRRAGETRSIKDKVGRFSGVQFGDFGLKARFKVIAPWLREVLMEAHGAGEPDFLGFSIDADGKTGRRQHEGRMVNWVEQIIKVHSVDVVTDPAAGGRVMRLVAAGEKEIDMTDEELQALIKTQVDAAVAAATAALPTAPEPAPPPAEPAAELVAVTAAVEAIKEETRKIRDRERLTEALAAVTMAEAAKTAIRKRFTEALERRTFDDKELSSAITELQELEASFAQPGANPSMTHARVSEDTYSKYNKALYGMFANEDQDGVPRFRSIKEAYCRWTGADSFEVSPYDIQRKMAVKYDSAVDHKRITESLKTTDWGEIYADNLYVMMINAYRTDPYNRWRQFVSDTEDVPDFQTRHWARVGGYADLGTVAEQATYPTLTTPTDEEVTYVVQKRGGIDDVTFEAIVGDRFNKIRAIPTSMARSASRTLFKFVMNLMTTDNANMDYDAVALYNSAHNNTGTTALSLNGVDVTQRAMRDQAAYNESAEILGERNKIKFLIVPNELEMRALRITNPSDAYFINMVDDTSAAGSGATGIDPQAYKGRGIEVVVYDQLTDVNDWWAVADPKQVSTLVVGFLGGQQEPELFVQDNPTVGSVFTADKVSYKIRHIYGGDILDHRSFYRQVVA